jgi:hypothetical protein
MVLNPPDQYADDRNLRARQRFWQHQSPFFDVVSWVLDLAGLAPGQRVLDAGCGNGAYLRALATQPVRPAGCDLSLGMLRSVAHRPLFNADVAALPVRDGAFDVVLAVHMLYHVPDRSAAVGELRRVLAPGGVCVAVTNGAQHLRTTWPAGPASTRTRSALPGRRSLPTYTAKCRPRSTMTAPSSPPATSPPSSASEHPPLCLRLRPSQRHFRSPNVISTYACLRPGTAAMRALARSATTNPDAQIRMYGRCRAVSLKVLALRDA